MRKGRSILAVVPARGGSVGIKLKNLREVRGVPLVGIVGRVLGRLDFVDRAVVSTDDDRIADAAEQESLAAPFRRPETLSGPRIGDWDVLHHALLEMEAQDQKRYDVVMMLQPTSPLRTPDQVTGCLDMLLDGDFDAVWTVSETDSKAHPLKQLTVTQDGEMDYYDPAGAQIIARQQLQPVYHRNGVAYAIRRDCLVEKKSIKGEHCGAFVVAGHCANIDTELDLEWAEILASKGNYDWL